VLKSEFYEITSASNTDFQPLDLSGAREVVLYCTSSNGGADVFDGKITNEPYANSAGFALGKQMLQPTVVHSTDDRLFWVSTGAYSAVLQVWVIRR